MFICSNKPESSDTVHSVEVASCGSNCQAKELGLWKRHDGLFQVFKLEKWIFLLWVAQLNRHKVPFPLKQGSV